MLKAISLFLITVFYLAIPASSLWAQQLKLGVNPTRINQAAVLELQSWNQGLLLTRVDTANVNAVIETMEPAQQDSTDGMIIYQVKDSSIYYRAGGVWHKLVPEDGPGIISLNGDSSHNQTLNVVSIDPTHTEPVFVDNLSGIHSLFLPDASESIRGLVNTGTQTFRGAKTINSGTAGTSGLTFTNLTSSTGPTDLTATSIGVNSSGDVVKVLGITRASGTITGKFTFPALGLNSLLEQSKTFAVAGANVGAFIQVTVNSGLLDGMWLSNPKVVSSGIISINIFQSGSILGAVLGSSYDYTLDLDVVIIQ